MSRLPRPRIRNCPICGLAMQGSRSEESAPEFDRFDCLACRTTIVERPSGAHPRPHRGES